MSTLKPFSWVVPSLTKQSYSDFESVKRIIGTDCFKMLSMVDFNTSPTSNLYTIA